MKKYIPLLLLVLACGFKKIPYLKPYYHHDINLAEPSDICLTATNPSNYYIVSNRGSIAEADSNGKILRQTKYDGSDYESVCMKGGMIYALDESLRRVDVMTEKDFTIKKSIYLHFGGGRNKAFEGLTYIPSAKKFIAVIEKPAMIYEYSEDFTPLNQLRPKQFSELSSVTYHNNYLWLLSDEDHRVMKVNPDDYSILQSWNVPVINPEGICFDTNGNLLIVSDDMSQLFKFKLQ
ncbi:MAG TPA: SdiA-regulated domain-containing protein [Chitinophagales bacterium]|nr:SdiA-regulated domain-containing protein [Chitinophagales bacterium]